MKIATCNINGVNGRLTRTARAEVNRMQVSPRTGSGTLSARIVFCCVSTYAK